MINLWKSRGIAVGREASGAAGSVLPARARGVDGKDTIVENVMFLASLQIINYILPLITVPYLVRVLGPEKYGLLMFAQAFIQYFVTLTDYGFQLSASRQIAIAREDKWAVARIFSAVTLLRIGIMIASFAIMLTIVLTQDKFWLDWPLYICSFGVVIGNCLTPTWFFQGIEKMKYIIYITIIPRLLVTAAIFFFIRQAGDYLYFAILNSLGMGITGGLSLYIIFVRFKVPFIETSLTTLIYQLKEGWHIFISSVAVSLFTISNTFILGIYTNNMVVGYYAAGEKIVRAITNLTVPVSQAIYPHVSRLAADSKEETLRFLGKIARHVGLAMGLGSLLLFIFADLIVAVVLGNAFRESVYVIKILALLPTSIFLNNIFGTQIMLNFDMKAAFARILISGGAINVALAIVIAPSYQHCGIAFAVMLTELYICLAMLVYTRHKRCRLVFR